MSILNPDFLLKFGEIKFAEENSLCISDFEHSLLKHLTGKEKVPKGRYQFGEINNSFIKDFSRSFKSYFK
jgi:hypothetical protein